MVDGENRYEVQTVVEERRRTKCYGVSIMEAFRPKENIPRMFLDKFYGFQYDEVETDDEETDVDETKVQR